MDKVGKVENMDKVEKFIYLDNMDKLDKWN